MGDGEWGKEGGHLARVGGGSTMPAGRRRSFRWGAASMGDEEWGKEGGHLARMGGGNTMPAGRRRSFL